MFGMASVVAVPCAVYRAVSWISFAVSIVLKMLFANRGSGQSVDCLAQTVDPRFAQQSMDCLRKLWIHAWRNAESGAIN